MFVKSLFTKSPFTLIKDSRNVSKFGAQKDDDYSKFVSDYALFIGIYFIVVIVLGFMAVSKIAPEKTEHGKNVRLGLYAMLFLTGGQVWAIYVLLWILGVKL